MKWTLLIVLIFSSQSLLAESLPADFVTADGVYTHLQPRERNKEVVAYNVPSSDYHAGEGLYTKINSGNPDAVVFQCFKVTQNLTDPNVSGPFGGEFLNVSGWGYRARNRIMDVQQTHYNVALSNPEDNPRARYAVFSVYIERGSELDKTFAEMAIQNTSSERSDQAYQMVGVINPETGRYEIQSIKALENCPREETLLEEDHAEFTVESSTSGA